MSRILITCCVQYQCAILYPSILPQFSFKGPLHPARMFCHSSQLFSVDSSEQVLEAAKDAGHPCNGTAGAACASREGLRQAKAMRE